MASFVKYYQFAYDLCNGVHDLDGTDTIKVTLTNTTPVVATHAVLAHISEISYTNADWSAGGQDIANTGTATAGTYVVGGTDQTMTATGGAVATFRYAVIYNDTPAGPTDPLIGYWDYGTGVTLATSETFTVDFGTSVFTVA